MQNYLFVLTRPQGLTITEGRSCRTRKEAEALAVGIKTGAIYCGQNIVVQVFDKNNREIIKK